MSHDKYFELQDRSKTVDAGGVNAFTGLVPAFRSVVARIPSATAISSGDGGLTFRDVDELSDRVARCLLGVGVRPGQTVGLCFERSPALIVGMVGILKARGAWLPLDPSYPRQRLEFMLQDSGVAVVLAGAGLPEKVGIPGEVRVLSLDTLGVMGTGELAAEGLLPEGLVPGEEPAYMIYTSGSTGLPKGAVIPHRAIVNHMGWMQATYPVGGDDVVLHKTPCSADASVWEMLLPLMTGARMELSRPDGHREPGYLADLIASRGVTVAQFVPTLLDVFVQHPRARECAGLRRIFAGGEALTSATVRRTLDGFGVDLVNLYGPTETAIDSSSWSCRRGMEAMGDIAPIGRPVWNTRYHIMGEGLEPLPIGEAGELYIGGVQVGLGYWNRPELTRERFLPDPFDGRPGARLYRTGDRCRCREDGEYEFLGRVDQQVKVRGFRVELGELEALLGRHPSVGQAAVLVENGAAGSGELIAFVAPLAGGVSETNGSDPSPAELRRFLAESLPEPMIPTRFLVLDRLPETPNGKIDRLALRAKHGASGVVGAGTSEPRSVLPPETPIERGLAEIWRELLRLEVVGKNDHFFEAGGHSILAMRLAVRILARWGVELTVRSLFENPTLTGMARLLERSGIRDDRVASGVIPRLVDRDRLPLSRDQERLWFEYLRQARPETYNVPMAFRIDGPFDLERWRGALVRVADRHEILRTRVEAADGRLWQVPWSSAEADWWRVEDVSGAGGSVTELEWLEREARRPFDLEGGWPWRCACRIESVERHVVMLVAHHLVCDEWSCDLWLEELAAAYAASGKALNARKIEEPFSIQFGDFAAWQQECFGTESSVLAADRVYWTEALDGAQAGVELPGKGVGSTEAGRGGWFHFRIDPETNSALRALAREEGATDSMVMLAAFLAGIGAIAGRWDVTVGMPVARRTLPELEALIGLFVNLVPVRVRADSGASFRQWLRRTQQAVLGAIEHGGLPYDEIVRRSGSRKAGSTVEALFEAVFVWKGKPGKREFGPELEVRGLDVDLGTAKFPVTLFVEEEPDGGWGATVECDLGRAVLSDWERWVGWVVAFWSRVVTAPDESMANVEWVSESEREVLLRRFNGPSVPYPREATIPSLFEARARANPGATAVACGSAVLRYGELNARANRLARLLIDRGVRPGDRVGVELDRSVDFVVTVLGILKAGAAYVPLPLEYPEERRRWMIEDAGLSVIVGRASERGVGVDLARDGNELDVRSDADLPDRATAMSAAYVMYTSGSTGRPKGVVIPQRGIVRLVMGTDYVDWSARHAFLMFAPTAFDASTFEIWGALLHGGRCVVYPDREVDLERLERVLVEGGVSCAFLTAGLFHQIVDLAPQMLRGIRELVAGGDVVSPDHAARLLRECPRLRLVNGYGPTESTTFAVTHPIPPDARLTASGTLPIGRPIANTSAHVVGPGGRLVPIGVVGELLLGGDGLALGYHGQEELTSERFVADTVTGTPGWRLYRTGDRCRWQADGTLEFLGRHDDQVKIRGFRIEPREVESVLRKCVGVMQAEVWVDQGAGGKELVAAVERAPDRALTVEELRRHAEGRLPSHMLPSAWLVSDRFPLTANGKLDRERLRGSVLSRTVDRRGSTRPKTETETRLAQLWSELLGIENVEAGDDFFLLGGHSLLALRLIYEIRRTFGRAMSVSEFLRAPTLEAVASALDSRGSREGTVEVVGTGRGPALFFIPGVAGVNYLPDPLIRAVKEAGRYCDALQFPGVDGETTPCETVSGLAVAMLARIRGIEPVGQVCLAGYSLGGNVAHEMACLMEAEGGRPALVMLYDAAAPDSLRPRRLVPALVEMARYFRSRGARAFTELVKQRLFGKLLAQRDHLAAELGLGAGDPPKPASQPAGGEGLDETRRRRQRVFDASFRAAASYRPRRYGGSVVLMRSMDPFGYGVFRECDSRNGWTPYVGGAIHVEEIPGDHWEMMRGSASTVLADRSADWLKRVSNGGLPG